MYCIPENLSDWLLSSAAILDWQTCLIVKADADEINMIRHIEAGQVYYPLPKVAREKESGICTIEANEENAEKRKCENRDGFFFVIC